ncbi:MAG: peptidylprolyl isomerase [Spirochaetes bacterium]|nr:peptidylprolyl isomerase [Spirochaetota bacterium]
MEWRANHILAKNRALAQERQKRLKTGANFESLAREHSTLPSRSSGGDLGWFGPGKIVPAFGVVCKGLGLGSISDVVQTQFGYHLIKLPGR